MASEALDRAIRLRKVVSGGQTGADQAGLRAARAAGFETGGWIPKGCLTENGPRPDLAELYGLREAPKADYAERTRLNVRDSQATLWLGPTGSRGWYATKRALDSMPRVWCLATPAVSTPRSILGFLGVHPYVEILNVAGPRESTSPGIGDRAERFLARLFRLVREAQARGFIDPTAGRRDGWGYETGDPV